MFLNDDAGLIVAVGSNGDTPSSSSKSDGVPSGDVSSVSREAACRRAANAARADVPLVISLDKDVSYGGKLSGPKDGNIGGPWGDPAAAGVCGRGKAEDEVGTNDEAPGFNPEIAAGGRPNDGCWKTSLNDSESRFALSDSPDVLGWGSPASEAIEELA